MEIKTAFSSQFNHDAAIRGFWCAELVCYSSLQSINEAERETDSCCRSGKRVWYSCSCMLFILSKKLKSKYLHQTWQNKIQLFSQFFVKKKKKRGLYWQIKSFQLFYFSWSTAIWVELNYIETLKFSKRLSGISYCWGLRVEHYICFSLPTE